MKEKATSPDMANPSAECPQCKGTATLVVPVAKVNRQSAVYGCRACGYTFHADGRVFVDTSQGLHDVFRAATLGKQTLMETMKGEKLNGPTKALFLAQIMEYGVQLYFDGLKQGLLLGAVREERMKELQELERELLEVASAPDSHRILDILKFVETQKEKRDGEAGDAEREPADGPAKRGSKTHAENPADRL